MKTKVLYKTIARQIVRPFGFLAVYNVWTSQMETNGVLMANNELLVSIYSAHIRTLHATRSSNNLSLHIERSKASKITGFIFNRSPKKYSITLWQFKVQVYIAGKNEQL